MSERELGAVDQLARERREAAVQYYLERQGYGRSEQLRVVGSRVNVF